MASHPAAVGIFLGLAIMLGVLLFGSSGKKKS